MRLNHKLCYKNPKNIDVDAILKGKPPFDLQEFAGTFTLNSIDLGKHVGPRSTYRCKKDLEKNLNFIKHYVNKNKAKDPSLVEKVSAALNDELHACSEGFHNRVNNFITNICGAPTNIANILAILRRDIVIKAASNSRDYADTHLIALFTLRAHKAGYGVLPTNKKDVFMTRRAYETSRRKTVKTIAQAFAEHYDVFPILIAMLGYIKGYLNCNYDYFGYKPGDGYAALIYIKIFDYLKQILDIPNLDPKSVFIATLTEDEYRDIEKVHDLNWPSIINLLFKKMIADNYFIVPKYAHELFDPSKINGLLAYILSLKTSKEIEKIYRFLLEIYEQKPEEHKKIFESYTANVLHGIPQDSLILTNTSYDKVMNLVNFKEASELGKEIILKTIIELNDDEKIVTFLSQILSDFNSKKLSRDLINKVFLNLEPRERCSIILQSLTPNDLLNLIEILPEKIELILSKLTIDDDDSKLTNLITCLTDKYSPLFILLLLHAKAPHILMDNIETTITGLQYAIRNNHKLTGQLLKTLVSLESQVKTTVALSLIDTNDTNDLIIYTANHNKTNLQRLLKLMESSNHAALKDIDYLFTILTKTSNLNNIPILYKFISTLDAEIAEQILLRIDSEFFWISESIANSSDCLNSLLELIEKHQEFLKIQNKYDTLLSKISHALARNNYDDTSLASIASFLEHLKQKLPQDFATYLLSITNITACYLQDKRNFKTLERLLNITISLAPQNLYEHAEKLPFDRKEPFLRAALASIKTSNAPLQKKFELLTSLGFENHKTKTLSLELKALQALLEPNDLIQAVIIKKLNAMWFFKVYEKRLAVIMALQKFKPENKEAALKEAIQDKNSELYIALNMKRYPSIFNNKKPTASLEAVKKVISKSQR